MQNDVHLQELRQHIVRGWSSKRNELKQDIRLCWIFIDELAIIDVVAMKGRGIIITADLQTQAPEQLHSNRMAIKTTRLLARESILDKYECRYQKYYEELFNMF